MTKPDFPIFKTFAIALDCVEHFNQAGNTTYAIFCIRHRAYLVAPKGFNPIKRGFTYP